MNDATLVSTLNKVLTQSSSSSLAVCAIEPNRPRSHPELVQAGHVDRASINDDHDGAGGITGKHDTGNGVDHVTAPVAANASSGF